MLRLRGAVRVRVWLRVLLLSATWWAASRAGARQAGAQEQEYVRSSLSWIAPSAGACIADAELVQAVEARVGRGVFVSEVLADVRLQVTLKQAGATWLAQLDLRDRYGSSLGTREVQSRHPGCSELQANLPLVIALLIDIPRREVPAAPSAASAPGATARVPNASARVAAQPVERERAIRWAASVAADLSYGLLPGFAPGASLQAGLLTRRGWTVELMFAQGGPAVARAAPEAGEVRFMRVAAGGDVCAPLFRGALTFLGCAGADGSFLLLHASEFDRNKGRRRSGLPVAHASLRAQLPLYRRLFARAELGALLPLRREHFVFRNERGNRVELHRPSVLVPQLTIGVGLWFR